MRLPFRGAGLFAAILMMVTANSWGAGLAGMAGFSPEQTAPAAGSPTAPATTPKTITLEQRADILMARKNYADAADYYERALKQSSKNPELWNKLGIAFQQVNKFHNAAKAFNNATRADKNFAEAWNNLGTVLFMQKKYAASVKYYQRAIELRGDTAAFHMNLGASYSQLKKYDQTVEEYRIALGIDPNVVNQDSGVGTVIKASGADAGYYFYMAKAFASIGNAEEAVRYLRRALEDGFSDTKQIELDPAFKKISQHPAFVELMRNPPVAIKN